MQSLRMFCREGAGTQLMDLQNKLAILADAAKYDASCASSGGKRDAPKGGVGHVNGMGICHSYAPDGRCISLLKVLLTNHCIYDCSYCINRISSPVRRAKFTVKELVDLTLDFYRRNYIEGLFLSSGVFNHPDRTMEEMVEVARQLRQEHRFGGYIHLKAVAGCDSSWVEKAGRWADRLSANIELPTEGDLRLLAPAKTHVEVKKAMGTISQGIDASREKHLGRFKPPPFAPAGQSTQMMVGATPSPDRDVLDTATTLYNRFKLRRVYYSAFSPIPHGDPRLPLKSPPMVREHRLYQADWLIRFYGFSAPELTKPDAPNLDLSIDPKLAWALQNRALFPVDINAAPREKLLRVPGFGVTTVDKILRERRFKPLRLDDLGKMHIPMKRTRYFVKCADHNVALKQLDGSRLRMLVTDTPAQLSLFETHASAAKGEL